MENRLNMSLDDLINSNKSFSDHRNADGRGGGRSFQPRRTTYRTAPYSINGNKESGSSSIATGTKLYISNLEYGVSNQDIKELFSEAGDVKRYGIHYDRSGRSKGTAEVVFSRRIDAIAAVKRYNNIELDGKPMKVEIVFANAAALGAPSYGFRRPIGVPRSGQGRGGPMGRPRGGRGFGRGRGRERDRDEKVSSEQLDAELDKYHSEAMQTN